MELMKELIYGQGEVLSGGILKIDSFLNHKFHPQYIDLFGKEFAMFFCDMAIDLVLTAESSGISLAYATARELNVSVIYARKRRPVTMEGNVIVRTATSPTKGGEVSLMVSQDYIHPGDNVLIIDDFLASGDTAKALAEIVEDAGANVAGFGFAVEKSFQNGRKLLKEEVGDVQVESLAIITEMSSTKIEFAK